jgi:formamidopyrimidine-DNA glycosylase
LESLRNGLFPTGKSRPEQEGKTMPELPDVEVFKRYLDATSLHKKIEKVRMHDTRVLRDITGRMLQKRLADRQLEKTRRHGKHLFVRVGDMGWLRLHFGMTGYLISAVLGLWLIFDILRSR